MEKELSANGGTVMNNSDGSMEVEGHGIKAHCLYDATSTTLTVTVESEVWYETSSMVDGGIKKALGTSSPLAHQS